MNNYDEVIDRWTLLGKNFYRAFRFVDSAVDHEIVSSSTFDTEGLPERWVNISRGESGWIPKIIFKIKNKS